MSNVKRNLKRFLGIAVACFCMLSVFTPTKAEGSDVEIIVNNYHVVKTIETTYRSENKQSISLDYYWNGGEGLTPSVEIIENYDNSIAKDENESLVILDSGLSKVVIHVGDVVSDPITIDVRKGNYAAAISLYDKIISLKSTDSFNLFSYLKENMYRENENNNFSDEFQYMNIQIENDPSLITIEQDGNVIANHQGSANLKITTVRNEVFNIPVIVIDNPVTSFAFESGEISLRNNSYNDIIGKLKAEPEYAMDGITRRSITWTSSDPSVASFFYDDSGISDGFLTTHKEGDVTITASWNGFNTDMLVHVVNEEHYLSSDNSFITLPIGSSRKLTYNKDSVSRIVSKEITSGSDVIELDPATDTVTALKTGSAEITYTDDENWSIIFQIEVRERATDIELYDKEVNVVLRPELTEYSGWIGYNLLPYDTADDVTYTIIEGDQIVEMSDDNSPRYVVKDSGKAVIRVTLSNGKYADHIIHAHKGTYAEWFDDSSTNLVLKHGETLDLLKEVEKRLQCSSGSTDFSDELKSVEFTVLYGNVVRLDNNRTLTALTEGKACIDFKLTNGVNYDFYVYVCNQPLKELRFYKNEYTIGIGDEHFGFRNQLTSIPEYMNDLISNRQIKWTSSDHSIATFKGEMNDIEEGYYDPSELVLTGKTGDITVTAEYEGIKAQTVVHVYNVENRFEIKDADEWNYTQRTIVLKPGEQSTLEYVLGEGNQVVSKEAMYNSKAFVFDAENDLVTAKGEGSETIRYTDLFGNSIVFRILTEVLPTEFSFRGDYRFGFRKDTDQQQIQSVHYNIYPFDAQPAKIKWELIGDSSILETVESTNSFDFIPLKSGSVTLKGTTENGLTASCRIELVEGDYATGLKWDEKYQYSLKAGETLDLAAIAKRSYLPENAELKDETFSYSIFSGKKSVAIDENGLLTALAEGKSSVFISSTNGICKSLDIYVSNDIKGLSFEKDYYEIPFRNINGWYQDVSLNLKTDPVFAAGILSNDDICVSTSDSTIMYINYYGAMSDEIYTEFKAYSPGEVTVTVKCGNYTAQTKVLLYEEKPQTVLNLADEMEAREGYRMFVPYSFGEKEKSDCYLEVLNQSDSIILSGDRSRDGEFEIFAKKSGTAKIRVTSVDNPNLYKDIKIKVRKKAPIDFSFSMTRDEEPLEKDSDGYYVLVYGEMYAYHMTTNAIPIEMKSFYERLIECGVLNMDGGAAIGAGDGVYEEFGSSRAGKTGKAEIEVIDGSTLKFKVVSDIEKANYGKTSIENKAGSKYHIDSASLEKTQKKLSRDINDRIDEGTLQTNINQISEKSDVVLMEHEIPEVAVDTNTVITADAKNKALIYDITPVVSLKTVSSQGTVGREIGETTTDISKSIDMELPVGDFIEEPDKPVYVVHVKEDGTEYVYEGKYDPETKTVKVTNPHGFSSFRITQVKPTVNQQNNGKPSVNTSDNTDLILYTGVGIFAVAVIGIMLAIRKKHS